MAPLLLVVTAAAATSATAAAKAPSAQQSATTTTRPGDVAATVDATGATDVTVGLQSFLNAVPDGGTARLKKGGTYRVEGTLVLNERRNLTIDGNGARVFATTEGTRERSHLSVVGGSGLVFHDLTIAGANPFAGTDERAYQPALAFQHGIRLEGTTDVEITRVRVYTVYGDFVYLGRSDDGRWSERVWIHDSEFTGSGRQGLTVAAGRDVVIERNSITNTRRATVDLEPNGASSGAENVHVLDNVVGPGRLLFIAAAGAGPVNRVVVARNHLSGRSLTMVVSPPEGTRYNAFYVVDNTTNIPVHRPPLAFGDVNSLVVTGNTVPIEDPAVAAVATNNVCGMTVAGNDPSPGTLELAIGAPVCDAPGPAANVPPPPAVAGRPVSAAPPPTTTTSSSSSSSTSSPTRSGSALPAAAPSGPSGGGSDGTGTALVVLFAFLTVAGVAAWAVLLRSERQRSARRQRPASRATRRSA